MQNVDERTVRSFGEEWSTYDQSRLVNHEKMSQRFNEYFAIFPWDSLPNDAVGADVGCGSGRWALQVAPRVGTLYCIDASSEALDVARRNLSAMSNCRFYHASVADVPLQSATLDFCYSLGVLHHVPDTAAGIDACAKLLKPGAPLLLYLYYALEPRPWWYRAIWRVTDIARRGISGLPFWAKRPITEGIAATVYWPLARVCRIVEYLGGNPRAMPLSWYRDKPFYTMRTNAYDRFATRLEQRFNREQIKTMMAKAGLENIRFSDNPPYWCVVGTRGRV
jgi:ubiquinone/menaquinone biosynthesis C-methylase UbiE